jgi:hypothetical protein
VLTELFAWARSAPVLFAVLNGNCAEREHLMNGQHLRRAPLARLGERGSASVEYLVGAMVVAFCVWAAMSDFGQSAIRGLELAGADILGL